MTQILAVAAGGAVGSVLRYLISLIPFLSSFPWSTLLVNMAGSFLLGLFFALAGSRITISQESHAFASIGLLGGFTTFSTFSHQTLSLWQAERFTIAGLNVVLNVALGLFAAWLGWRLGHVL
ncbi:fluoride efflux transporter CrcB [Candidatus Bipolaricaulota bacterium]|nr:fluoride efflux transporter CrcB [Candidatus Bipolaricaulota bacterium]